LTRKSTANGVSSLTSWIIERVILVHEILSTYIEGEGEDDGGEKAFSS
jgi:hypothetical protein